MFNLIQKDILLLKYIFLILLPILIGYLLLDNSSILMGFLASIILIQAAFAIDEKPSINILLNSLPYTRKEIVSSKYIGSVIYIFIIFFAILIMNLVMHGIITPWEELFITFLLVIGFTSFMLPFLYRFKSQYLLIASLGIFVTYLVVIGLFIHNLNDRIRELVHTLLTIQDYQIYLLLVSLGMILYVGSWFLSVRIYRNKVF
ncbi:ABC-2 transporter permease [Jeotgalibacillus sp. ET6]|uniref:ABC-2 transporter permease n=1 Tax=Jeotgalibacillus sp. ET6 TaxID=3037260 RepID=UPI0024181C8E|nr:ABC-2 transporter permease [Jeotgalibacillus sp. ET6]MDG5473703.1 ABC-2 transporter permease [Jeotgalibacillus sp. ET6]